MKKKLKLYSRLETLKKKEIIKEQYQSNLISKEILKADGLIEKIDIIIFENSLKNNDKFLSAAVYKNKSNLLSTLNNQKYVAENKKEFLEDQKKIFDLNIAKISNDKKIVKEKYKQKLNEYREEIEDKNHINFKKKSS